MLTILHQVVIWVQLVILHVWHSQKSYMFIFNQIQFSEGTVLWMFLILIHIFTGQLATGSISFIHQSVFVMACEFCIVTMYTVRLQLVPLSDSELKGWVKRNEDQLKLTEEEEGKRFFLCSSSESHPFLPTLLLVHFACVWSCFLEVMVRLSTHFLEGVH